MGQDAAGRCALWLTRVFVNMKFLLSESTKCILPVSIIEPTPEQR